MSGELYEVSVATLLFLRCMRRNDTFHLACNHSLAGAFDDLVLVSRADGTRPRAFFIQLKYKKQHSFKRASLLQLRKKDGFSLPLYCKSYGDVRDALEYLGAETDCQLDTDDIRIVLFTNAEVEVNRRTIPPSEELLSTGGWETKFDPEYDADIYGLMANLSGYKNILEQMVAVEDCNKLLPDSLFDDHPEILRKLRRLATAKDFVTERRRLLDEVRHLGDMTQHTEFLKRLTLFCDQANLEEVSRQAREELRKLLGTDAHYNYLLEQMTEWWRGDETHYITRDCIVFRNLCSVVACELNKSLIHRGEALGLRFDEEATRRTLKSVEEAGDRVVYLCNTGTALEVSTLRICQSLPADRFLVVTADALHEIRQQVLALLRTPWYPVLVVEIKNHREPASSYWHSFESQLAEIIGGGSKRIVAVVDIETAPLLCSKWTPMEESTVLTDLDCDSQNKILDTEVKFQGRIVQLRHIRMAADVVDASLIQKLAMGETRLSVGTPLNFSLQYYVPRRLIRACYVKEEFVISPPLNCVVAVTVSKGSCLPLGSFEVIHDGCESEFYEICAKFPTMHVHWLHLENRVWRWIRSSGGLHIINKFLTQDYMTLCVSCVSDVADRVVPIVAVPGMGKSTLLSEVAWNTKKADPGRWVVRIDLGQHTAWLDSSNLEHREDCDILLERAAGLDLEDAFARKLLRNAIDVAVLVDAFDEISPTYTDKGAWILRMLVSDPRVSTLWATSRPVTSKILEDATGNLQFQLEPFGQKEQDDFFRKYWRGVEDSQAQARNSDDLVRQSLDLLRSCHGADGGVFAEIPLHAFMMAEAFTFGGIELPTVVDVVDLYANFVDKKLVDRLAVDMTRPETRYVVEEARRVSEEKHIHLALQVLLPAEDLPQDLLKHEMPSLSQLDKSGIVFGVTSGLPQFVHKTFAEYFASIWLSRQNFRLQRRSFLRVYSEGFEVLRVMLDRILAKESPMHLATLDNDVRKLKSSAAEHLFSRDAGGRTLLTLAAINNLGSVIDLLATPQLLTAKDDVLEWTPLQYAVKLRNWDAAEALLKAGAPPRTLQYLKLDMKTDKVKILLKQFVKAGCIELVKVLVEAGANVDDVLDADGCCAVSVAALHGHLPLVRLLYDKPRSSLKRWMASIWSRPTDNYPKTTPLHMASKAGHASIVRFLLERSQTNVDTPDYGGRTALHFACGGGHLGIICELINAGSDLNSKDNTGLSPLLWAERMGRLDVVWLLIEIGASIHIANKFGETPLHWAAQDGQNDVLRILLETSPESVDYKDNFGKTALHCASAAGNLETVRVLIDAGAEINVRDNAERTPVLWACGLGYYEIVSTLLQHGANINFANSSGETPLHLAAIDGNIMLLQYLLASGASVDSMDSKGQTPLHKAADFCQPATSLILLNAGADVNARDAEGNTALHLAASTMDTELIKSVLSATPDVDASNASLQTPLHCAAAAGMYGHAVRALLQASANPNAQDRHLRTPLHLAARFGNVKAAEVLLQSMSDLNAVDDEGLTAEKTAVAAGYSNVATLIKVKAIKYRHID